MILWLSGCSVFTSLQHVKLTFTSQSICFDEFHQEDPTCWWPQSCGMFDVVPIAAVSGVMFHILYMSNTICTAITCNLYIYIYYIYSYFLIYNITGTFQPVFHCKTTCSLFQSVLLLDRVPLGTIVQLDSTDLLVPLKVNKTNCFVWLLDSVNTM